MSFPTLPELPRWATTTPPAAPSSGQQDTGWVAPQVYTEDLGNWLHNRAYEWHVYTKGYLDVEHDDTDGTHTNVNLDSISHKPTVVEVLNFAGDLAVPSDNLSFAAPLELEFSLGSPDKGAWVVIAGAPVFNIGATPPNTSIGAGDVTLSVYQHLTFLRNAPSDTTGERWLITKTRHTYVRNAAGDTFAWALSSTLKDGTAAVVVEASGSLATTGAAWTQTTTNFADESVNPLRTYWMTLFMDQDVGSADGEVAVCDVDIWAVHQKLE